MPDKQRELWDRIRYRAPQRVKDNDITVDKYYLVLGFRTDSSRSTTVSVAIFTGNIVHVIFDDMRTEVKNEAHTTTSPY